MSAHTSAAAFIPRKNLGQNFLVNPIIAERIISACNLHPEESVLEIGPGTGALTHILAQNVKSVTAIEKDARLAEHLKNKFRDSHVRIIHADFLKRPLHKLGDCKKVVGNIPYNIATAIIGKIIDHRQQFDSFYMTVQLEYGQRMTAAPNSKKYGSLSCFIQYYADAKILFKIRNTAFHPVPKVQSCFVRLNLRAQPALQADDEDLLFAIIRCCFNQRRKIIQNSMSGVMDKTKIAHLLQSLGVNPNKRAENLSVQEYVAIANAVGQLLKKGGKNFGMRPIRTGSSPCTTAAQLCLYPVQKHAEE